MQSKTDKKKILNGTCPERLRVIGEETRLAVLRQLIAGPRTVGELNQHLKLEQSLLSHHLRLLREEGFVVTEKRGRSVRYILSEAVRSAKGGVALNLGCCELTFEAPKKS